MIWYEQKYFMFEEKLMRNIYRSEQNGRSMVEMLGVLAIIGCLQLSAFCPLVVLPVILRQ